MPRTTRSRSSCASRGRSPPDFATIESGTPALKTRFFAEDAAAAAIAAGGAVAADIWTLRGGARQEVRVGTREAAASLVSFRHQAFADASKAPDMRGQFEMAPTAAKGFHLTRDGRFVFLHPSFPASTERLLNLLACPDTPEAVAATLRRWNALDFESAVAAAGACAGLARTPEEWDRVGPGSHIGIAAGGRSDQDRRQRAGAFPGRRRRHRCRACGCWI
ncbi:MAG: CoA transferase [Rhizomicrobium sp.]